MATYHAHRHNIGRRSGGGITAWRQAARRARTALATSVHQHFVAYRANNALARRVIYQRSGAWRRLDNGK